MNLEEFTDEIKKLEGKPDYDRSSQLFQFIDFKEDYSEPKRIPGWGEIEEWMLPYGKRPRYKGKTVKECKKELAVYLKDKIRRAIGAEVETGGVSGGSCWDSSNPQSYKTDNPEPEISLLDIILEKFIPSITYLQYRALAAKLIKRLEVSDREYYGNRTDYLIKYLYVDELFDYIREKEWIK